MVKKALLLAAVCANLSTITYASEENPHYVLFHYSVKSLNKDYTDQDCAKALDAAQYYDIDDDESKFFPNNVFTSSNYKRIQTSNLNSNRQLFRGVNDIALTLKGKKVEAKEYNNFALNKKLAQIRGFFEIPNYCAGQILGTSIEYDKWPQS